MLVFVLVLSDDTDGRPKQIFGPYATSLLAERDRDEIRSWATHQPKHTHRWDVLPLTQTGGTSGQPAYVVPTPPQMPPGWWIVPPKPGEYWTIATAGTASGATVIGVGH